MPVLLAVFVAGTQWIQAVWSPVDLTQTSLNRSLRGEAFYLEAGDTMQLDDVVHLVKEKPEAFLPLTRNNLGYVSSVYWIVIPFRASKEKTDFLVELKNPQVDRLQAFYFDESGVSPLGPETGDILPFRQRLFIHRNFVWPLPATGASEFFIILRVDKRNSTLNIPLYVWDANTFRSNNTQQVIFYGVAFGMLILMALYSLGAWMFLRKAIYGWYLARIITGALLLMAAEGLAFQLLYPQLTEFNGYFRVFINGLQGVVIIRFSQLFLGTKAYVPRINKILEALFYVQLGLCISFPFLLDYYVKHSLFWLPFALVVTAAISFSRILAAVLTYRFQRTIALFYLAGYCMTLLAGLLLISEDFGWIEKLQVSPLFIAVLLEALILSVGLTYLVKKVYDERNDLSLSIARHQKEKMLAYIEGVEKERVRIAGELHDDIGSRLGNLRRMVNSPLAELEKQIEIISNGVRTLSHQLAPPVEKAKGIQAMLRDLVVEIQPGASIKLELQCFDVPEELPEEMVMQLFRITQEVLNNTIKHSHATHADIQFFGHEKEIVLSYEDDGRGFDLTKQTNGIGLNNVKARVESMQGHLEITSAPGEGVQMMISIPLP